MPRVRLETPSRKHAVDFLGAARGSVSLHRAAVSPPNSERAYGNYIRSLESDNKFGWFVIEQASGGIAGVINVSEIVRGCFQSGYLGYYALVPHAGKGLMREGLACVVTKCFRELRLHRLEANIQPWNRKSISLVSGLGFVKEGFSRRYLKISGRWQDHERWAILSEDWRPGQVALDSTRGRA